MMLRSFAATVLAALVVTPAAANEPNLLTLTYAPWIKTCLNETCFVWSEGHSDCASVVSAALIERLGEPKKTLSITLPPRVNTERGVRIIIDQSEPIERPNAGCRANGCMAEYEAGAELVANLKHGRILALEAVDKANSPISLAIPLVGFADAYDSASHEPKVFETTADKLQAEIDERKTRCETVK
ncbi:MAG: invasion associated locus B family protein [Bradyrhizobium sp.]